MMISGGKPNKQTNKLGEKPAPLPTTLCILHEVTHDQFHIEEPMPNHG
jgi:hypothetical protein